MTTDPTRWAWALLAMTLWLSLWLIPWRQHRRHRLHAPAPGDSGPALLIAFASQSGQGAQWAERTARMLHAQGRATRRLPLDRLRPADLDRAHQLLLIASTTGEGDAPDNAAAFETRLMRSPRALPQLRYGLLARGDRSYARFCAFGRRLDAWLHASGATPAFARIEADGDDPATLGAWLQAAARLAGADDSAIALAPAEAPEATLSAMQPWRLQQRHVLNAGSTGAPVHHVVLQPLDASAHWQAGDVIRLHIPAHGGQPAAWREYSLASLPHEGHAELLVREVRRADGSPGLGSGWLCHHLALGAELQAQLRRNPGFHTPDAALPLVLIGNGTGLAGLAAHLKARERARQAGQRVGPAWLLHGERHRAFDAHWDTRLQSWLAQGLLQRLDRAFSRDTPSPACYVQHLIAPQAELLRQWVADGAVLCVCGQRAGMAQGVDEALAQALGREALDALQQAGSYRRDVY